MTRTERYFVQQCNDGGTEDGVLKLAKRRALICEKTIFAVMSRDWVEPYCSIESHRIPVVIQSDHERFGEGCRLDWGFVQTALRAGYQVVVIPDQGIAPAPDHDGPAQVASDPIPYSELERVQRELDKVRAERDAFHEAAMAYMGSFQGAMTMGPYQIDAYNRLQTILNPKPPFTPPEKPVLKLYRTTDGFVFWGRVGPIYAIPANDEPWMLKSQVVEINEQGEPV